MSLEDALNEAIDTRLKELGLLGKGKGKKAEEVEEEEEAEVEVEEVTKAQVKDKFVEFVKKNGSPAAKKILKRFKIAKLQELEEEDYSKMYAALGGGDDEDVFDEDC